MESILLYYVTNSWMAQQIVKNGKITDNHRYGLQLYADINLALDAAKTRRHSALVCFRKPLFVLDNARMSKINKYSMRDEFDKPLSELKLDGRITVHKSNSVTKRRRRKKRSV